VRIGEEDFEKFARDYAAARAERYGWTFVELTSQRETSEHYVQLAINIGTTGCHVWRPG